MTSNFWGHCSCVSHLFSFFFFLVLSASVAVTIAVPVIKRVSSPELFPILWTSSFLWLQPSFLNEMSQRRVAANKNTYESMNSENSYVNAGTHVKPTSNGYHSTIPLLIPSKRTVSWKQLPEWLRDNAYITDGYRPQLNSYVKCAQSIFYLHNEFGK
jgi:hypothetical protein